MFEDIGKAINALFIICCISVPLGIWKIIDIIVWICKHVKVDIQ